MNGSTLIQLFKSLDKADRRQLRKFISSPYFNQREDVTKLFEYIDKNIELGAPKLMKEKAYAAVYPKQKFDVDKFYYPMSFLTQTILKYLAINELEQQTPQYNRLLSRALRERGIEKVYEKTIHEAKNHLEKQPLRNGDFHYDSFLIRSEEFESRQRLHRDGEFELQEMSNDFHFFCISEILRLAYGLLSHQSISKKEYQQPLLESALKVAEQHLDVPAISMHYYAYQTLIQAKSTLVNNAVQNTDGDIFQNFKTQIIDNQCAFSKSELLDLLTVAINYCIRQHSKGSLDHLRESLELYSFGLENHVFMENGVLSPYTYKNACAAALGVNNFDTAERFLNDYKSFLPEKERENIYNYNLAIFHYRRKDYATAMTLLREVNLKEVLFNLDSRRLLTRIYFDLKEFDALNSLIESSKVYLHRQKDIGYHKETYANFFRIVEKILKADLRQTVVKQLIREEVEQIKALAERDWILSKLA